MMYHEVRGQELLKLWVFYNMLDIGDRLLLNFGQARSSAKSFVKLHLSQDVFDAVHCAANVHLRQPLTLLSFLLCFTLTTVYTVLHTLLILYQVHTSVFSPS